MAGLDPALAAALFAAGLLGGGHCLGMCGGIVALVSASGGRLPLTVAYNLGRVISYGAAGALAGWLGAALSLTGPLWPRIALLTLAALLMIGMGLYLMGLPQLLLPIERVGGTLWRRIEPVARRFLPVRSPLQALAVGLLWGWLPCGLVYSALATALATGGAISGAAAMLAFGAGTLPLMLVAGTLAARWRQRLAAPRMRRLAGGLVVLFGVQGLWRVGQLLAFV